VAGFFEAVQAGEIDTVTTLLARQPSLASARDDADRSAVLVALYHRHPEVGHALADAGADLDVFDAAALGRANQLAILLGLDPALAQAWSSDGFTALHYAAFFGTPGAAALLLDAGAPADSAARNPMQVRPLHSAAASGQTETCRLLLAAGASVDARQQGGFTALHAAAGHGDAALVELLLVHGADPSSRTDTGEVAADLARAAGHAGLADRLAAATVSDAPPPSA
jgi:ankyrin repeat protein